MAPKGTKSTSMFAHMTRPQVILIILVILCVILFFAPCIFKVIHPGEAGVLFRRCLGGTDTSTVYGEGVHVIFPWDEMVIYDVRVQETSQTIEVITKNGLTLILGVSIHYRPKRKVLGLLHQTIGPDYLKKVVVPKVTSVLRTKVGQFTAEELFSTTQPILQGVFDESFARLVPRYIVIDDVIVRTIRLPPAIQRAVEAKIEQQHLAEAYEFRLAREQQEARRKEIEAQGYKSYNEIIASSLSTTILQWKGIEATQELARSPNAKVIVVGNGPGNLPIILGADK